MIDFTKDCNIMSWNWFKGNVSYAQLKEYLSVSIENNLLKYIEGTQTYKTSGKELNYLKMYNEIGELLQQTTFQNN